MGLFIHNTYMSACMYEWEGAERSSMREERKEENIGNITNDCQNRLIGLLVRVFANDPGDLSSIPRRIISKTFKMVLDTSFVNTQQYKVRIKGKVEQSRERSSALPYTAT